MRQRGESWLGRLLSRVAGQPATDWTLIESLPDPGLGIAGAPIEPDGCYVEIYVESLRLKQARRFAVGFHGVVYAFARLSRDGAEDAELAAISKPAKLAELDPGNIDRVITVSDRMIGAAPWRGGALGLELGLFSVKKGNLLSPLLDYVAQVSEVGGASFIGQAKPFLPLITAGMDLIAGQTEDTAIEVALDTTMELKQSLLCAIVAVPRGRIERTALTIDPGDRRLLLDGRPLDEAYCVFSIRRTDRKADFGQIPELKTAWAGLREAVVSGDRERAEAGLDLFRRTVIVCADLIHSDRERLIQKAQDVLSAAFPRGPAPVGRLEESGGIEKMELSDLPLYD